MNVLNINFLCNYSKWFIRLTLLVTSPCLNQIYNEVKIVPRWRIVPGMDLGFFARQSKLYEVIDDVKVMTSFDVRMIVQFSWEYRCFILSNYSCVNGILFAIDNVKHMTDRLLRPISGHISMPRKHIYQRRTKVQGWRTKLLKFEI